ncbi:MAG: C25 family peptidase propeptide domain-containing protein, partial [Candidatus Saliniplasma sp.]
MTTRKKCIVSVLLAALLIMSTVPFLNDSESAEFVRADSQDKSFPLTTDGDQLEIDHSTDGDVDRISYNINGFDTNSVNIDETEYDHISIEGATNSLKEGYPDLPTVSRSLIIPD